MKTYFVVTGIIKNKDKYLILKKSPDDRNYPNKWSFCSGFVKEFEPAEEGVLREIKEETSLDAKIIKQGKIIEVLDNNKRWVVAVYLCESKSKDVKLCHENVEFRWASKEEIKNYDFVPGLEKEIDL